MSRNKKEKEPQAKPQERSPVPHPDPASRGTIWRRFPGPTVSDVPLRVTFDRAPYADLVAHAKESLDVEVGGVLCGDACEDEAGLYVHVRATIPGTASRAGSTHVTFTQDTWTAIHTELEAKYPHLAIVGWYHSHPGFGVVFSDMDLFIQKNFFPGPAQIALVTDPLGGSEALCVNGPDGIRYVDRFWVEGRERRTTTPSAVATDGGGAAVTQGENPGAFERLETRINQALALIEEQRRTLYGFVVTTVMLVAFSVIGYIGYNVYQHMTGAEEPPRLQSYIPIPLQVGDQTVLLGVGVVNWQVPPKMNAAMVELERRRQQAAADSARASQRRDSQP